MNPTEPKTETAAAPETNPTPNRRRNRATAAKKTAALVSLTPGDRAYPADKKLLTAFFGQYPFIQKFLTGQKYDTARNLKIFLSHNIKTESGKTARIQSFIQFPGTNKTKRFDRPTDLTFSVESAAKKYPDLKPLTALTDPTLYITVESKTAFRFYISFKN